MSLVHNERWKLTAAWLNTLGSAVVVVGFFTPVAAIAYGIGATPREGWLVALLAVVCMALGGILHLLARMLLGRLRP